MDILGVSYANSVRNINTILKQSQIKKVVRSRAHFLILKSSYSQSNYKSIILNYSKLNSIAAFTKSRNKGCGFCGRDKNSGWNCPATNQRCPGISIISTNPV